jgi:hypothetical protein
MITKEIDTYSNEDVGDLLDKVMGFTYFNFSVVSDPVDPNENDRKSGAL